MYSPFVFWGQTESILTLRVDLKKAENPLIHITESQLSFSGCGYGARGQNQYLFHIDFYDAIKPDISSYKVIDRDIAFVLQKKDHKIWPRLLQQTVKPPWLKVDFDKMYTEENTSDEDESANQPYSMMHDGLYDPSSNDWKRKPNLFRNIGGKRRSKSPSFGRRKNKGLTPEEFRKVYLFLYNLFQCVGSCYSLLILAIGLAKSQDNSNTANPSTDDDGSSQASSSFYPVLAPAFRAIQMLKLLEVIHPVLSFTTGDSVYPAIGVGFRLFALFFLIEPFDSIHDRPVVHNILFIWSLGDIIRYAYYMIRTFKIETFLTWLYYTSWMILYPIEFLCIGVLILIVLPIYDESQKYTIGLPNAANLSFSMATVVRIFALVGFFPVFTMFAMRMYKKRKYRLHTWKKAYKDY